MRKFCALNFALVLALWLAASPARAQFKNGSQATELNLPRLSQRANDSARRLDRHHHRLSRSARQWTRNIREGRALRKCLARRAPTKIRTIAFTDDVSIEGHALPAGTYGLHMIPTADEWTIIFSKNSTSWGSFSYDEKEDALRVTVKPAAAENRDTLAYTFDDIKPDSAAATAALGKSCRPLPHFRGHQRTRRPQHRNQLRSIGGFTWRVSTRPRTGTWTPTTNSRKR